MFISSTKDNCDFHVHFKVVVVQGNLCCPTTRLHNSFKCYLRIFWCLLFLFLFELVVCEVSLHSTHVRDCLARWLADYCLGSYCSISLFPCAVCYNCLVRETFVLISTSCYCWRIGRGLVLAWFIVVCISPGLFRQFFTIRETLWYHIYPSLYRSS